MKLKALQYDKLYLVYQICKLHLIIFLCSLKATTDVVLPRRAPNAVSSSDSSDESDSAESTDKPISHTASKVRCIISAEKQILSVENV